MNALTLCLLAMTVALATAQGGPFCHTCELMLNDVIARNPNGFGGMSVQTLETQMYQECDKYVPTPAFEDAICKQMIQKNEVQLLQALQQGVSALVCCQTIVCIRAARSDNVTLTDSPTTYAEFPSIGVSSHATQMREQQTQIFFQTSANTSQTKLVLSKTSSTSYEHQTLSRDAAARQWNNPKLAAFFENVMPM
uniref:Saposin B-type domain-containing protein n=1 Tax=Plectus sambesii TaxID=2011161 RepID=A0A914VE33_9BILA